MLRFFRTGQIVPEWLEKISAPEDAAIPFMTFGSPTIVVRKGGAFHLWSATSFGKGSTLRVDGKWEKLIIEGQGAGVHIYGTAPRFLKAIFRRAAAKGGR